MARSVDQAVAEQLGNLSLQLAIAQARYEAAEERVAELAAKVSMLEAQLKTQAANAKAGIDSPPNGPTPKAPKAPKALEAP